MSDNLNSDCAAQLTGIALQSVLTVYSYSAGSKKPVSFDASALLGGALDVVVQIATDSSKVARCRLGILGQWDLPIYNGVFPVLPNTGGVKGIIYLFSCLLNGVTFSYIGKTVDTLNSRYSKKAASGGLQALFDIS